MAYTLCTVTVDELNIRAQPTSQSALVATYPRGTVLNFVEVVNGENVDGNPRWGHSEQGHYYWLGGTDYPNGPDGNPTVPGNDYPHKNSPIGTPDEWEFFCRECTSFVAWRMNHQYGINFTNHMRGGTFGNADTWANNARSLGYRVDNTPSVGAVAMWGPDVNQVGPSGHVALVAQVNSNGTVTVEQFNWGQPGHAYSTMTIPANNPSCYILCGLLSELFLRRFPALTKKAFTITPGERMSWSWQKVRSQKRRLLILLPLLLLGGSIFGLFIGMETNGEIDTPFFGPGIGLLSFLLFSLPMGLLLGLSQSQLDEHARLSPNQGIWHSLREWII